MGKYFDGKLEKHHDWGAVLDPSDGKIKPASGLVVQEYLKNTLERRFGCLHEDQVNQRYLLFADEANRDLYLENPFDNAALLLGSFLAPSEYTARINLISESFNSILEGVKNIFLEYTFEIINKSNTPTGENVIVTYTIHQGNDKTKVQEKYKAGQMVRFKLDDYLKAGTNRVVVQVMGETTLASTSVGVNYEIVKLVLNDTYPISKVYHSSGTMEIPYHISGSGVKHLEWFIDGIQQPEEANDVVTQTATSRTKNLSFNALSGGEHSLQFRAYVEINNERFYTGTIYKQFVVDDSITTPYIGYGATLPVGTVIQAGQPCIIAGLVQYENFEIPYAPYHPSNHLMSITVKAGQEIIQQVNARNGDIIKVPFRPTSYGRQTLTFIIGEYTGTIQFDVSKSSLNIDEITAGLKLALSARGRSNQEVNRESWVYGDVTTTFHNFDWSQQSGWQDNKLLIPAKSYISVAYKPFGVDIRNSGATLELELESYNVNNHDDTLISCMAGDTGILITGQKISLKSRGGKVVSTFYKHSEKIRVAFVVHKTTGDNFRRMMFIYINGILMSMNEYVSTDTFLNTSNINIGSATGTSSIAINSIRGYGRALVPEEILNNHILYQDNIDDMLSIYDKNDIYIDGQEVFDIDKIASRVPVLIATGEIKKLLETKDKNLTIYADLEFINRQNPALEFKGTGIRMKPQGTSSMQYPIKNFRFYLKYGETYNNLGEKITSTKIKSNSIPVSTFCLKADYAESSGTHNTGVARLWNDLFANVQLNGQYVCRTQAQKAALSNNYPYDVRTAVDGYPIVMFYRETPTSPLVFLGHYNYNNDKSTENVFGFKDIPGFDNSKMACWEHLNNTHPVGLFTDLNEFDSTWEDAFEARYPEDYKPHHLESLKAFATWVNSTATDLEKFKAEKSQHINLHLMAAYYIYLIRFGAVDQVVKNSMLTTEDGVHFYYIHYDNDTILGVRNDGLMAYPPTITRQTLDTDYTEEVYCYAGHDSVLWNNLEADEEFMALVREMDNALYQSGLTYAKVIEMFDEKQMAKWCERIYNNDHITKYIQPYQDQGINNLFMAQGSRQQNRRYWLSNRFAIYDAMFVSGEYRSKVIDIKSSGVPKDTPFTITAGKNTFYGFGINNLIIQAGIELAIDGSHTFTTPRELAIGDPVRIYNAHSVKSLDIANFTPYLAQFNVDSVYHNQLGTCLENLTLNKLTTRTNTSLKEISGLQMATALKTLHIVGFKSLTAVDLSTQKQLEELDATNSGVTVVSLYPACPLKLLKVSTPQSIVLRGHPITVDNLIIGYETLTHLEIHQCVNLMSTSKDLVLNWVTNKTEEAYLCKLSITDINWTMTYEQLRSIIEGVGDLTLQGVIYLDRASAEIQAFLEATFGPGCTDPAASLYISMPETIYLTSPAEVSWKNPILLGYEIYPPDKDKGLTFTIHEFTTTGGRAQPLNSDVPATIDQNGLITVTPEWRLDYDMVYVVATSKNDPSIQAYSTNIKTIHKAYPGVSIGGTKVVKPGIHELEVIKTGTYDSDYTYEWSLSDVLEPSLVTILSQDQGVVRLQVNERSSGSTYNFKVNLTSTRQTGNSIYESVVMSVLATTYPNSGSIAATDLVGGRIPSNSYGTCTCNTNPPGTDGQLIYEWSIPTNPGNLVSLSSINGNTCKIKSSSRVENTTTVTVRCVIKKALNGGIVTTANATLEIDKTIYPVAGNIEGPSNIQIGDSQYNIKHAGEYNSNPNVLWSISSNSYVTIKSQSNTGCVLSISSPEAMGTNITLTATVKKPDGTSLYIKSLPITIISEDVVATSTSNKPLCDFMFNKGYANTSQYFTKAEALKVTMIANGDISFSVVSLDELQYFSNLTSLGSDCFYGCSSLTSLTLPSSVTSLGNRCFTYCSKLASITIPSSVTNIGNSCFENCSSLASITCLATKAPTLGSNVFGSDSSNYAGRNTYNQGTNRLYVPDNATGYDAGRWLDPLCNAEKCGFTKEALPAVIREKNSILMDWLVSKGYVANPNRAEFSEVQAITSLYGISDSIVSLDELQYFTGVTKLSNGLFYGCRSLVSVKLPNSITSINDNCFENCSKLASINIPSSVTSLGNNCFYNCYSLASITIPDGVTSLGSKCFSGSGLTSIKLPSNLTSLGSNCFYWCSSLTSLTLPSSVTSLGSNCFHSCSSLASITCLATKAPTLGSNVFGSDSSNYAGRNTYNQGTNRLYVPVGATGYDSGLWADPLCDATKCGFTKEEAEFITFQDINVAKYLESTGVIKDLIATKSALSKVTTLPVVPTSYASLITTFDELQYFTGLTSLGNYCFNGCSKLASITLPSSLTSLGGSCFRYCTKLTNITIPNGVTSLGNECFQNCSSLTSITLPSSITSLGNECFSYCTKLTGITLPDNLTSLGGSCFQNCSSLTSITLPSGVTSLGERCFQSCPKITSITIPNGVTSLGSYCFSGCSALASITLPSSLTSLGSYYCFSGCSSLTSINIPNNVTSLGICCFSRCSSLTSITLPSGVTSLGTSCFSYCTKLTGITLPDNLTSLGDNCFESCTALASINTPGGVTSLGSYCFSGCSALASITLPSSLTSLGDNCFKGCSKLTSINLPSGITSLGGSCFESCTALTSITCLPTTVPNLGNNVFGSNSSTYTGRNTYNQGTNRLYVPVGATGYDSGLWADPLCDATKCGFTLSQTL